MNYNHLLYFQTLARHEHYRKAAEELHITQPSLSKAIANLEADLGVALFEKKGRGVRLTAQGTRFLDYVSPALHELQVGEKMLRYEQPHTSAYLNLGLVMSIAYDRFPAWITGFREQSGLNLFYSCTNDTSDALVLGLKAGDLDLIICSGVDDPSIVFMPLFDQQLILLVPDSHPLASRKSISIRELNGLDYIAHRRGTALHGILADIWLKNNISVRIVSEADEDRAIIGMVRAGLGCGVTTQSSEIYGAGFRAIPVTGSGFEGKICIGRPAKRELSHAAKAFFTWMTQHGSAL